MLDSTSKFVHRDFQHIFKTAEFKNAFDEFKKSDDFDVYAFYQSLKEGATPLHPKEKILAFKNDYLRKKSLIEGDEIKVSLYLPNGKFSVSTAPTGQSTVQKDDFQWIFQAEHWEQLSFPQRYTFLHWLQASLSREPLPPINLISKYNGINVFAAGYDHFNNEVLINPTELESGLQVAGALAHEMVHFNQFNNMATDESSVSEYEKFGIKKKRFLDYTDQEKRQIINLGLDNSPLYEQDEILKLKYIICPATESSSQSDFQTEQEFKRYLPNEIYLQSPTEVEAYNKHSEAVSDFVLQFRKSLHAKDRKVLNECKQLADDINSFKATPVLGAISKGERNALLNASVQNDYYQQFVFDDVKRERGYSENKNNMMRDIYQYIKDKNIELERG